MNLQTNGRFLVLESCNKRLGKAIITICICLFVFSMADLQAGELMVTHKQVRDDKYELSVRDCQWTEGWGELDQFFPRHYKPACTLHLFLKNTGKEAISVNDLLYNGKSIKEVCTRPDYLGPVIWYRTNPESIPANGTAMVYVRLRKMLAEKTTIGVECDNGKTVSAEFNPGDYSKLRIASAGFDLKKNKMFVFVKKYSTDSLSLNRCFIDGSELAESDYFFLNRDFTDDNPAYIEISPKTQLKFGQFLVLRVEDRSGNAAVYQLRIRDDKFLLGMIGGNANLGLYQEKLFNMIVEMGSTAAKIPEGFWNDFADNDFSYVQTANTLEDLQNAVKSAPPERFAFGTIDEPDGVDCMWYNKLPHMERCGVNIMQMLEPRMALARKYAPSYLTQVLVNRTYTPANWFIYGETPDLYFNDAYPLYHAFASDALEILPPTVATQLNATAPRPVNMVLWGVLDTTMRRTYTPLENDMQVHYAIGSGAKGIHYFMDRTVYWAQRYMVGPTNIKPLWTNMGRLNAKITRIASLLNAGCPFDIVKGSNDNELWVNSLMCGKDSFVIVAVNKNYRVYASGATKMPFIFPVEDEKIEVSVPDWIEKAKVVEVSWDKVEKVDVIELNGKITIPVKNMMTSRVYVISSDQDIERRLEVDNARMDKFVNSTKLNPRSGKTLGALTLRRASIKITPEQVQRKRYTIDFGKREDIEKAIKFNLVSAELDLIPGERLALFPLERDFEGRCELIYGFESDKPLKNLKVTLASTTPNFAYCANNTVEISGTDEFGFIVPPETYASDCSFKTKWDGGSGENLEARLNNPPEIFYIKVTMKDPQIVWSGEYSNTIEKLDVSWDLEDE